MQRNSENLERLIKIALEEDVAQGDATSQALIPAGRVARFAFVPRESVVMCGGDIVPRIFRHLDPDAVCEAAVKEGAHAKAGMPVLTVHGNARALLSAERTALNFMQRLCGVATLTRKYVDAVAHTKAVIRDTRKTIPAWRALDKYAVRTGGGQNHRMNLSDAVLIKDNHLALYDGLAEAVEAARAGTELPIEVECDTLGQVEEALGTTADVILLDNMDIGDLKRAVAMNKGLKKLEASGGVTLDSVREVAEAGVDYIAIGAITHSAPAVDIGLDFSWG